MVRGDAGEFERLLVEHPRMRRYDDGRDRWLGEAATEGSLPIVQLLVRLGTDVNEPANNDSVPCPEGVVYRAAENGHLEVVKLLVERGAAVNASWAGMTPLDHALAYNRAEVAAYLRSAGGKEARELASVGDRG